MDAHNVGKIQEEDHGRHDTRLKKGKIDKRDEADCTRLERKGKIDK